jgi:hypothetical protein
MLRFLTILGVLCAAQLAAAPVVQADPFSISCRVMDPATRTGKKQFLEGEQALLWVKIDVAPSAIKKQINVVAVAKVKVSGFNFKAQILEDTIDIPSYNRRQQIPGWGNEDRIPDSFSLEKEYVLDLPNPLPEGTVKLKVVASLRGLDEQHCQKSIEIL